MDFKEKVLNLCKKIPKGRISTYKILADECVDFRIVKKLRAHGFDVVSVLEAHPSIPDKDVLELAKTYKALLLTEDKDFGWLVYVSHADSSGVILMRFPGDARRTLVEAVMRVVEEQGDRLLNAFVVVQPGHVRISY